MKYFFGCLAGFLFFGWLPILVGTFDAVDAVIGGILGVIIALLAFGIYEIKMLRQSVETFADKDEKHTEYK